jgi:hypothetical protein
MRSKFVNGDSVILNIILCCLFVVRHVGKYVSLNKITNKLINGTLKLMLPKIA